MKDCLSYDSTCCLPPRREAAPQFEPKTLPYTCKERKQMDLQDSFSDRKHQYVVSQQHEEQSVPYPLSKMSTVLSTERSNAGRAKPLDNNETTICPRGWRATDTVSAKELKQLYDLRSSQALPFGASCHASTQSSDQGTRDVQKSYNKSLSAIRGDQRNYSDIFAVKEPADTVLDHERHITAKPNRDRREVRQEIYPADPRMVFRPATRQCGDHKDEILTTARERYIRELSTSMSEATPRSLWKPSERLEAKDSHVNADLFGRPLIPDRTRPQAKVGVLRLHNIPASMSESDLVEGIRRCHCYITKLWLPYNVLLGNHKGVGSIIVRESWCPSECEGGLESRMSTTTTGGSSVDDECSDERRQEQDQSTEEPFARLHRWFKEQGITVSVEETSTE